MANSPIVVPAKAGYAEPLTRVTSKEAAAKYIRKLRARRGEKPWHAV